MYYREPNFGSFLENHIDRIQHFRVCIGMAPYGSKQPSADYCAALYVKFNVVYAEIFLLANELFTLRSHNVYYMDAFS